MNMILGILLLTLVALGCGPPKSQTGSSSTTTITTGDTGTSPGSGGDSAVAFAVVPDSATVSRPDSGGAARPASPAVSVAGVASRGDELLAAGHYTEALKAYQALPETPVVLKQIGICQLRLWNLPAAILAFRRAKTANPSDDELTGYLAEALTYNKNFDEALPLYRDYLVRNPANLPARTGYARTLAWTKDLPTAIEQYQTVLKRDPEYADARMGLAEVLVWQKELDRALGEYTIVTKSSAPKARRSEATKMTGDILSWKGDYPAAIERYQEAIAIYPSNVDAFYGLGQVYEWTGEYKRAKAAYQQILQIQTGHKEARARLATLLWVK